MVEVTKHAEERLIERCGLNKKSVQRIADKAFNDGIRHGQTKGNLKKWVDGLYFTNKTANNIRLYGDKAFIFTNERLITVIQIPSNLRNDMKVLLKINQK